MQKKCKKCNKLLHLTDFYKSKQTQDGYLCHCKDCMKENARAYRKLNIEKVKEYDRNRPNAVERGQKQRNRIKNSKALRQKCNKLKNKWTKRNPEKKSAQRLLGRAVQKGLILKPKSCSKCKSTEKIEAHHYDYKEPLEVDWLCISCHNMKHRLINESKRKLSQRR